MLKKWLRLSSLFIFPLLIFSCGNVGDADIGNTVIVTASVSKNYVEQDIITTIDGSCNYGPNNSLIPPVAVNEITINALPLSEVISNPSPVSVTNIEISYTPLTSGAPPIDKYIVGDSKLIDSGTAVTLSFPVIDSREIENFARDFLGGIDVNYTYYVDVRVKLKEVYTNKDLEKQVRFTLSVKNVIDQNECTNTNTNNNANNQGI